MSKDHAIGRRLSETLLSIAQRMVVVSHAISNTQKMAAHGGAWRIPLRILANKSPIAPADTNHIRLVVPEPLFTATIMASKGKARATEPSANSAGHLNARGMAAKATT